MRGKSVFLFAVLSTTALSQSAPEPYSVKADKLGETITEWKANNPRLNHCQNSTINDKVGAALDPDVVYCLPRASGDEPDLTYATAPLVSEVAWFYRGTLYKLELPLRSTARLALVMAALGEKFGTATEKETTPLQNGFGAKFVQERWTWKNGVSTLQVVYSDAADSCPAITFTLDAPNKEVTDRWEQTEGSKARSDM